MEKKLEDFLKRILKLEVEFSILEEALSNVLSSSVLKPELTNLMKKKRKKKSKKAIISIKIDSGNGEEDLKNWDEIT